MRKSSKLVTSACFFRQYARKYSYCTKNFKVAGTTRLGKIIKIMHTSSYTEQNVNSLIKENADCLFIGTMPTKRTKDVIGFYSGHNFSFVTDKEGNVEICMSKRPNTSKQIGNRVRVEDSRLSNYSRKTHIYQPKFLSVSEEIQLWIDKAKKMVNYPIFFHIIPFSSNLDIDKENYTENVKTIIDFAEPYSLHSVIHPQYQHVIPASNCNTATEASLFGFCKESTTHDMSCQEAVMSILLKLVGNKEDYLNDIKAMGLTDDIEKSTIAKENYYASFTG